MTVLHTSQTLFRERKESENGSARKKAESERADSDISFLKMIQIIQVYALGTAKSKEARTGKAPYFRNTPCYSMVIRALAEGKD